VNEWVALPEFKAAVLDDMQRRLSLNGGDTRLKAFERVRDIHITREPFSIDNGLLTPTLKLKRFVVKKRYQRELDSMYNAAAAAEACRQRRLPMTPMLRCAVATVEGEACRRVFVVLLNLTGAEEPY
jgi:hypothetical protein